LFLFVAVLNTTNWNNFRGSWNDHHSGSAKLATAVGQC